MSEIEAARPRLLTAPSLTPPHDIDAEAAVISATLIDPMALDQVADLLRPEHFYSESHRRLYEAALAVREAGQPVDIVQVGTWLRDRDRLAQVGGMAYLTEVLNAAPAVANVRAYATTVLDKWLARQVLLRCQKFQAVGYSDYGTAEEYLNNLSRELYELGMGTQQSAMVTVKDVIIENMKAIAKASENGARIAGLATGFDRYDRMTSGLHDGELTVLAARPGMGKTSYALNVVTNVAAAEKPGGAIVFSLEMPRAQLGLRMLASEARVDVSRIRTGMLTSSDWSKLQGAAVAIAKMPIWVDDTPAITLMAMRSKARRTIMDAKTRGVTVRLLAIDYLQLMKGEMGDSREQEVSSLSRGLKQLAKELCLPIVVLSQLNRKNEERADKRPQLSDLRECVTGDQVVVDALTGDRVTVREVASGRPIVVHGLGDDWKVRCAPVSMAWSTGRKPVVRITTESGRTLRCTTNHPVRTIDGWREVGGLRAGDRIAVPRKTAAALEPSSGFSDDELRMIGYLICDGHYGRHRSVGYVKADPVLVQDVSRIANTRFGVVAKDKPCQGIARQIDMRMDSTGPNRNPLIQWLKAIGIHGQTGPDKTIPDDVFRCDASQLGIFMGSLWAGDGSVVQRKTGGYVLKFTSTATSVLDGVQDILVRLGIVAARGRNERNSKSKVDIATISIGESDAILRFAEMVTIPGIKGERLAAAVAWCRESGRNARVDRIPLPVTQVVAEAKAASGLSWTDLGYRCQGKEMCRQDLARVARTLGRADLQRLAESDVLWDPLISVVPDGEEETFDLRVPGLHNFVVGNVFVHNSGAIEQDADNVCFIHRPDYYDKKGTADRNVADLIIAKQRNGPTDTVKVRFDAQYTRFDNLAEGEWEGDGA